jgi:hypothetical protein
MIFKTCFTKAKLFSINRCRQFSIWLVSKYNSGQVVLANNGHLVTPAGSSIYGVLISSDTARYWL